MLKVVVTAGDLKHQVRVLNYVHTEPCDETLANGDA